MADSEVVAHDVITEARLDPEERAAIALRLVEALEQPGRPVWLPSSAVSRLPAALLPVLALASVGTPVHVVGDPDDAVRWSTVVAPATGAALVALEEAALVVAAGPLAPNSLWRLRQGSASVTEERVRVVLRCRSLRPGGFDRPPHDGPAEPGGLIELEDPAMARRRSVCVEGIDVALIEVLGAVNSSFPAGADAWLVADLGVVVGLPRSTQVEVVERWDGAPWSDAASA